MLLATALALSLSAQAALLTQPTFKSTFKFPSFGSAKRTLPPAVKAVYTSRFRLESSDAASGAKRRPQDNGASPPPSEATVAGLWSTCVAAYGSEELALRAVTQNPTILNPKYTNPPTVISNSKKALIDVLGSEAAAIEVMLKNPAVLQCGAALSKQEAEEIRSFANARLLLDSSPPWAPKATIVLVLVAVSANIILRGNPEAEPILAVLRPALGAGGAGIFGLTACSFARIVYKGQ